LPWRCSSFLPTRTDRCKSVNHHQVGLLRAEPSFTKGDNDEPKIYYKRN
jgi:hypothetical protein